MNRPIDSEPIPASQADGSPDLPPPIPRTSPFIPQARQPDRDDAVVTARLIGGVVGGFLGLVLSVGTILFVEMSPGLRDGPHRRFALVLGLIFVTALPSILGVMSRFSITRTPLSRDMLFYPIAAWILAAVISEGVFRCGIWAAYVLFFAGPVGCGIIWCRIGCRVGQQLIGGATAPPGKERP